MRYWDAAALVPLVVRQGRTAAVVEEMALDGEVVTWWGTLVECASAVARLARDGELEPMRSDAARVRLRLLADGWEEVEASDPLRQTAVRLLHTHPLRAGDALQLAAAIVAAQGAPASLTFVTLDDRLADAASREGFPVLRPGGA